MRYTRYLFLPVFLILGAAVILIVNSCKKDPTSVGLDLLPPSDTLSVKTIDTSLVIAYSVIQDSVRSDETTNSLLGSIMDPYFGITTASFCTQMRLSKVAPDFGTNPVMDSLILLLKYTGVYGDTTSPQHIRIYELSENIYLDSAYYCIRIPQHYSTPIADITFTPNLKDSVRVGTGKQANHLRINLSKISRYFGDKLLYAPATEMDNNASFVKFMKGIYIEASPRTGGGGILSFSMSSTLTKMIMYYHNSAQDTATFDFTINTSCARYNVLDHNGYKNADPMLRNQILNHDTALGKNMLYIQGLGGIRTRVRIPYIEDLKKLGNIAINNAVLLLKNYETDTTLAPPTRLHLYIVDSLGRIGTTLDSHEGDDYFGGFYSGNSRTYKFRLTRQVQNIILGKLKNYDFYIMANDPSTNALIPNRVQLIGTNPLQPVLNSGRLQLEVTYTKLHL